MTVDFNDPDKLINQIEAASLDTMLTLEEYLIYLENLRWAIEQRALLVRDELAGRME